PEPSSTAAGAAEAASAAATPEALAAGRALVEKAVAGMGGAAALDGVRAYREVASVAVTSPQGEMALDATATIALPDRVRQDMTTPMGRISMVIAGDTAAAIMPDGAARSLPAPQRDQIRQQVRQSPVVLLQARAQPGFSAAVVG